MSLIGLLFPYAFHVASSDSGAHYLKKQKQYRCMLHLIGLTPFESPLDRLVAMEISTSIDQADDACTWKYVLCDASNSVLEIHWANLPYSDCDLDWFPSSVSAIDMQRIHFTNDRIETRRLPRCLKTCRLEECGLTGEIDLRTLPETLIGVYLYGNHVSGTVQLTRLPTGFRRLDLQGNMISSVLVDNSLLPKGLVFARLWNNRSLKFVCLDGKNVDVRVTERTRYVPFYLPIAKSGNCDG